MAGSGRFTVGDHVHVRSLGKGVVREARNGRRYLVEVKGRHMVASEDQLSLEEGRTPAPKSQAPQSKSEEAAVLPPPTSAVSLDLHGLTTDEAVMVLDGFLSDAILAGSAEVRIIHGRSGGRLRAAVHARLKMMTAVRSFRIDPRNPGVTLVAL